VIDISKLPEEIQDEIYRPGEEEGYEVEIEVGD
jgi:hypothetical protein